MRVEVAEVRVQMVGVPIERIVFHAQVVARDVTRGVAQVVELVPQDSRPPVGPWHDLDLEGDERTNSTLKKTNI